MNLLRIAVVSAAVLVSGAGRAEGAWYVQLKGCVKNAEGAPVPGAVLQIEGAGLRPVTADARGCYQIAEVPEGVHKISVSVQGATLLTAKVDVQSDKSTMIADFQLRPASAAPVGGFVMLDLQALSRAELRSDDPPPPPPRRAAAPKPAGIAALTFEPDHVVGGEAARGVARLTMPAPAGGLGIKLSSNLSTAFAADITVHVPEGATSAEFEIPTKKIYGPADVRVRLQFAEGDTSHASDLVVESSTRILVSKGGAGAGTVVSVPPGITCGWLCSAPFAGGSTVRLAATPAEGSVFAGWSGDCANGVVVIGGIMNCTATFNLP